MKQIFFNYRYPYNNLWKYPLHYYYYMALSEILGGVLKLFTLPFGYSNMMSLRVHNWVIRKTTPANGWKYITITEGDGK